MKKWLLAIALLFVLTACGAQEPPAQEQPATTQPAVEEVQQDSVSEQVPAEEAQPLPEDEETAVTEEAPANTAAEDPLFEQAYALIDSGVEELYDTVGYPIDVMYADSCLGEGEDGELYYDGFTVYTYRDTADVETIYDVMKN